MSEGSERWRIVIEEWGRMHLRWAASVGERSYPDPQQAREAAMELARTYQPEHPSAPSGRTILRHGDDGFLVTVQGRVKDFHFRISVCEQLE